MPPVLVIFYKEDDGTVPLVEWVERLPKKPREKCFEWIDRLMTFGIELHRPYADTLRNCIHELRVRFRSVNYRMLYFFQNNAAVVLTHGLTKESRCRKKRSTRRWSGRRSSRRNQNPTPFSGSLDDGREKAQLRCPSLDV